MYEEEVSETEEKKRKEEKRNIAREMAESFPKFLINAVIVLGVTLFYFFVTPLFITLDLFPIMSLVSYGIPILITGYSLLRTGVILIIILFGVEALKEFAKFADVLVDFIISRLPGMRSTERATVRRIPLDLIYILFTLVIYIIIQPVFDPSFFPIPSLAIPFQILAVSIVLFLILTYLYDIAKSIQKSAKRGINNFGKRLAGRFEDEEPTPRSESEY